MSTQSHPRRSETRLRIGTSVVALAAAAGLLGACSSATTPAATPTTITSNEAGRTDLLHTGTSPVLPVDANPISNTSTEKAFTIESVLVENNQDANGKATDDHLEIAIRNNSGTTLTEFEVFYTFIDPATKVSESYYLKLPATFTIDAGVTRSIHFDDTGADGHLPVNSYSLYYTDTNALDVTVEVSAANAAPQTTTVQKDAGGAETAD